jgi:hypothetical protein
MPTMAIRGQVLVVKDGEPLVAVPGTENGQNVTYYFIDDGSVDNVLPHSVQDALSMAGAWSGLDWDEMYEALDRIRHESEPTPPIDDL